MVTTIKLLIIIVPPPCSQDFPASTLINTKLNKKVNNRRVQYFNSGIIKYYVYVRDIQKGSDTLNQSQWRKLYLFGIIIIPFQTFKAKNTIYGNNCRYITRCCVSFIRGLFVLMNVITILYLFKIFKLLADILCFAGYARMQGRLERIIDP